MPRPVACAVIRDHPPEVLIAEDQETLNWVLALHVIARTPGSELPVDLRERLRAALRDERWGEAVSLWIDRHTEVDVYPSFDFYTARDVELASEELQFDRLRSAAALVRLHLEADFHAFAQFGNPRSLDGSDMHEHIFTAAFRRYESVAFRLIEKLDGAILAHTVNAPYPFPQLTCGGRFPNAGKAQLVKTTGKAGADACNAP